MTAYEAAIAEVEAHRAEIEAMRPAIEFADELAARYEGLRPEVGFWRSCQHATISLVVNSLAEVQPMLAEIVRSGYHPKGRTDYTDESCPRVTYDYGQGSRTELCVNVRISSTSDSCRLVQVGEKTVPVLEIVCI